MNRTMTYSVELSEILIPWRERASVFGILHLLSPVIPPSYHTFQLFRFLIRQINLLLLILGQVKQSTRFSIDIDPFVITDSCGTLSVPLPKHLFTDSVRIPFQNRYHIPAIHDGIWNGCACN